MEQVIQNNKKYRLLDFISDFFLSFFYIVYYAFIGLKACTYDLFVFLYSTISWRLDKAYKRTKEAITPRNIYDEKEVILKKPRVYKYSSQKLNKLNKDFLVLQKELETFGATRTKEVNVYYYTVQDPSGKIFSGVMNGLSKLDINTFLVNEGYKVFSIKTSPLINFFFKESSLFGGTKLSVKDLVFWLTQLSTYLKSGINLNDAIKILTKQMKFNKNKERAFKSIIYELTVGSSFSDALEKQGAMFPPLLINMIKAAEASGTLIETLDDMAKYYTEVDDTKKAMKSAMMYPIIISTFALVVVVFIMIYIIPRFVQIYDQNNIKINPWTMFIINASAFLKSNIVILLSLFLLGIIVFYICYKNIKAFRRNIQIFLMHIPVIKDIIIYNELAIFTKTFASLLRNNVFITESIDILSKITNNEIYKGILYRTIRNIIKGEKISEAFNNHWAVPDVAYFMIVTGEDTGDLDEMMQKVSDYYQGLHKSIVNNLKAFIEPVLIAVLALVVGAIIISVVIPMFGMYEQVMV